MSSYDVAGPRRRSRRPVRRPRPRPRRRRRARPRGARPGRRPRRAGRPARRAPRPARRRAHGPVPVGVPRARPRSSVSTVEPSYVAAATASGHLGAAPRACAARRVADAAPSGPRPTALEAEFCALARTVDPDDPWSHPDAARARPRLARGWLRSNGAPPAVVRERALFHLGLAAGVVERTSLLSELRKVAAAGAQRLLRRRGVGGAARRRGLGDGRAADGGGARGRIRLGAAVTRVDVAPAGLHGDARRRRAPRRGGRRLRAAGRAAAARSRSSGVSDERLRSLDRQRHALAAKVVAPTPLGLGTRRGQNGVAVRRGPARLDLAAGEGVLSMLVAPERLGAAPRAPDGALRAGRRSRELPGVRRATRRARRRPVRRWGTAVDARVRHQLAPRRRHGRRPAARHARAAVLRLRLGPVGRGLHGGRGADRRAAAAAALGGADGEAGV